MRFSLILCFISAVIIHSCQPGKDTNEEKLREKLIKMEQEVMDIHDKTMEHMADLNNYQKVIKTRLITATGRDSAELLAVRHKLVQADSLMWEWMYNYKKPDHERDLDSVRTYLESEMARIKKVDSMMSLSMRAAEAILK